MLWEKNLQFLSYFKKNGAGARVLDSTFSFFDESFSQFACFSCKTYCDPTTRPPASLGVQGSSEGSPRGPKRLPKCVNAAATAPQSTPKEAIMGFMTQQSLSRGPKRSQGSCNYSQEAPKRFQRLPKRLENIPRQPQRFDRLHG